MSCRSRTCMRSAHLLFRRHVFQFETVQYISVAGWSMYNGSILAQLDGDVVAAYFSQQCLFDTRNLLFNNTLQLLLIYATPYPRLSSTYYQKRTFLFLCKTRPAHFVGFKPFIPIFCSYYDLTNYENWVAILQQVCLETSGSRQKTWKRKHGWGCNL